MIAALARRLGVLAFATLLGLGLVAAPGARPAAAAAPSLTIVGDARYDVRPQEARVAVGVHLVATNHLTDTATKRYFFDRAYLTVPPAASNIALGSPTGAASVRVAARKSDHLLLLLSFGQKIYSGKSAAFDLRFDLHDAGGAPTRELRVGTSLVSFPVWAYASDSTAGSTVTVTFPAGFTVSLEAGTFPPPTTAADGTITYASGRLASPLSFFAFFVADRPSAFTSTPLQVAVGSTTANLELRAWPDDAPWSVRVGGILTKALPALATSIGLPWSRSQALVVQEAVTRSSGGYSGLFDPAANKVEIAYYADPFVVLHEAAHAWFNGALLADRWANEGFASWYALQAASAIGEKVTGPTLTADLAKAKIPLNAWAGVQRTDTGAAAPSEGYGYAASLELARQIATRAGEPALQRVWAAASRGQVAYQPAGGPIEAPAPGAGGVPDWRGFLDLLEDETGKSFDDLWRTWVVRPEEASLLDQRATARSGYAQLAEAAGDWRLPRSIRDALRAWQFDEADTLMADARGVLTQRTSLEAAAKGAGLTLPPTLKVTFESDAGLPAAAHEAALEQSAIDALSQAVATRPTNPGPLVALGLVGAKPDDAIATARDAFARGDLAAAVRSAAVAQSTWLGAGEVGRNRLLTGVGIGILVVLVVVVIASWIRGRRHRGRSAAVAEPAPSNVPPGPAAG